MRRGSVILLAVACLLVEPHFLQASVIIKTDPHANVKMEFGAHHVPPHDVALLDESAKVDGTTRLGIEVPHSHNHRNVLIHKIGTYLTVVMKALAKTVAPSQNQDGKTHFDIHVDADLGENDNKFKKDESPQFTIVHSKNGEVGEQIKGDCVKAVVIVSESADADKKEEHKSSEKHPKDEHKKKDSHIVFHYSSENSKESKDHHKQNIHHVLEEKIQVSKEKKEEKKEALSEPFKFQPPKDWESFKKTQDMFKEKGFVLQVDKSFFISKENQQKSSQNAQHLDVKNKIKHSLEGKSLSEEEMEESERNWKSLELTEPDSEEMWISMINPTDINSRYQSHSENNEAHSENPSFSKIQTVHTSSANDLSKGGKQIQTVKTTYQSGPVIVTTTKSVAEVSPNSNKAVSYEIVKETSTPEKFSPTKAELSFTSNEIPSHISSHFQQTSYSSDRSRAITIVSKDPAMGPSKGGMSQPGISQVKDKLTAMSESSYTVPHLITHDDSSREVIMRLAPASKTGPTKKAQIIDVKKVKITKSHIPDEAEPDGTAIRHDNVRNLPMANIPTLIDVLQKSPPQEVQRLTQLAGGGSSHESQKDYLSAEVGNSPVAPTNITDPSPSKSPRDFQLPEMHVSNLNSEERKGLSWSIEDHQSSAPIDYKETSKAARNEKLYTYPEEIHTPNEEVIAERPSEISTSEHSGGASQGLEVTKKSNLEDHPRAEEPRSLNYISENPSTLKSMEVSVSTELNRQQKEPAIDAFNNDGGKSVQENAKDSVDHEGERDQKTFRDDTKTLVEENKPRGTPVTITIEGTANDPRAKQAFNLCSLTASAEEARALDISSHQLENQPAEAPIPNDPPVEEVAVSGKSLNQESESPLEGLDVSDTAEEISEVAGLGSNMTSTIHSEEVERKEDIFNDESPSVKFVVHAETKVVTPSEIHSVLSAYDDSSYAISPVTEPSTTPSLPEKESMSIPLLKERELFLEEEPKTFVSNLVDLNEAVPGDEVGRDGRIYDSQLGASSLLAPLSAILPETSVTAPGVPLNNAIHDTNSPYIYSYYPAFYPKGTYTPQNKTEDAQGLYGRPSPRVICVSTDTGKLLGDSTNTEDQSNAVAKYSPEVNKSNKEDDKLMLLKLLHEDIQKLKHQLKIQ